MLFGSSNVQYLIVGLGNPGKEYDMTRHNIGFRALDYIAGATNTEVRRLKHMALTGKATIGSCGVLLMKPQTYMNNSGEAVADAARFYKVSPSNVIVISDDISLTVGSMRIRASGSAGGHNGLKSIQKYLGTEEYVRIKLGVGAKAHADMDLGDHVLGRLSASDFKLIAENFSSLIPAIELIMQGDFDKAMARYNRSVKV